MKERKSYATPAMDVVAVNLPCSLLADSGEPTAAKNANIENATLNGFDDTWE
jgi:hypothetical protein